MLAPNAYSQLSTEVAHSPETHTVVSSVVYDVRAYNSSILVYGNEVLIPHCRI